MPDEVPRFGTRIVAVIYGSLCHCAFVVGVGAMIAAMAFGMSRSWGRVPAPWTGFADGMLLLQFPLLHSALLSRPGQGVLARLAPLGLGRPLATTTYVLIASLQTLALFALWTPSGIVWWRATGWVLVILLILYTTAWLMLLTSIIDAGIELQTGFLGWRAVVRGSAPAFPPMPTKGLFRVCRQPIYLAFALTVWTVPVWTPDQLAVAIVLTAYCVIGPLFKEARFRRLFGQDFLRYQGRVPYWLPWPRPAKRM